jgi:hypothetical protein
MANVDATRTKAPALDRWADSSATPTPQTWAPAPAPWNVDYDKIPEGIRQYDGALFTNPALTGTPPSATKTSNQWPMLPPMPDLKSAASTGPRCTAMIPSAGNANVFADRGVPLSVALKDGAFGSTADLERFRDEYVAYTATRPEAKQLHTEALRCGPEILAKRLDVEDAEQARRLQEQQVQDRLAPLRVQPPLSMQQRAAVGEVAIPIARTVVFVGKFVPVAGSLIALSEAITGRSIAGLGEKLGDAERAVDAALALAPFAAKALAKGVRGAAETIRLARATGRSVEETRTICRVAVDVSRNRTAVQEGLAAAKAGRALTTEQRAAMGTVGQSAFKSAEGEALRRRMYKPTTTMDKSLPAGEGVTDKYGNVSISPHGTAKDIALAEAHESVHSFLSPKALNGLREFRADLRIAAYQKSELCQFLEEALAESYAQVKVNGIRSLPEGLSFPIREGYVTLRGVAREGAIGAITYGGVLYGVHVSVNRK